MLRLVKFWILVLFVNFAFHSSVHAQEDEDFKEAPGFDIFSISFPEEIPIVTETDEEGEAILQAYETQALTLGDKESFSAFFDQEARTIPTQWIESVSLYNSTSGPEEIRCDITFQSSTAQTPRRVGAPRTVLRPLRWSARTSSRPAVAAWGGALGFRLRATFIGRSSCVPMTTGRRFFKPDLWPLLRLSMLPLRLVFPIGCWP